LHLIIQQMRNTKGNISLCKEWVTLLLLAFVENVINFLHRFYILNTSICFQLQTTMSDYIETKDKKQNKVRILRVDS